MNQKGGTNALAHVLQQRMNAVTGASITDTCDFGTVQADGSLLLNFYPIPIPHGDYLVCRHLKIGLESCETSSAGNPSHTHTVKLPDSMSALKAGDTVLVCWVKNDVVVIDVIG